MRHHLGGPVGAGSALLAATAYDSSDDDDIEEDEGLFEEGAAAGGPAARGAAAAPRRNRRPGGVAINPGGPASEVLVLHHVPGVPGATQLYAPAAPLACDERDGGAGVGVGGHGQEGGAQHQGGARAEAAAAAAAAFAPAPAAGMGQPRWFAAVRSRAAAAVAAATSPLGSSQQYRAAAAATPAPPATAPSQRRLHAHHHAGASGGRRGGSGIFEQQQPSHPEPLPVERLGLFVGGRVDELLRRLQQPQGAEGTPTPTLTSSGSPGNPSGPSVPQHTKGRPIPTPPGRSGPAGCGAMASGPAGGGAVRDRLPPQQQVVRVFHGVCTWAPGQLEGELRGGVWGLVQQGAVGDVVGTAPGRLWRALMDSGRLRWM